MTFYDLNVYLKYAAQAQSWYLRNRYDSCQKMRYRLCSPNATEINRSKLTNYRRQQQHQVLASLVVRQNTCVSIMGTLQAKLVILSLTAVTLLGGCAGEVPSPIVDALENYLDLLCVVELDLRYDVERANADFEFWYAVGTTGSMDALTLFKVEQLLFSSINENDLWCTQIYNTTEDVVTGNRDLQAVQRLGIVTFTPGSKDAPTECTFPPILIHRT